MNHQATNHNTELQKNENNNDLKNQQLNYLSTLVFQLQSDLIQKDILLQRSTNNSNHYLNENTELIKKHEELIKNNEELLTSTSWKITKPVREFKLWLKSPKHQIKRYLKYFIRKISTNKIQKSNKITIDDLFEIAKSLHFKKVATPQISIIIPIYGQISYTVKCLKSISDFLPKCTIEIIVVNDCSPDNSLEVLSLVNGITILSNEENKGFIRSCNKGANAASGKYVYFLNNDTEVTKDWLDELLLTFKNFPGTGYVGSKLIYPDGRLQEAGGLVWGNGTAWNFGRLQDPLLPVYNYAREVDYCSGASIMLPRSLFLDVGGFDEHYLPAYCEDTDLAIKLRDKGYRVIYQPLSTVIHYEGITSGTDETKGVKSYQVENLKKLFNRWERRISQHQTEDQGSDNAKDRRATKRVLYIDHGTPTPDQDSGSIDAFNHMLLLREMDFQVTFFAENHFNYVPDLQRVGIEVLYRPFEEDLCAHIQSKGNRYDLVFICRPDVAKRYMPQVRKYCSNAKVLFHTVDLHFLRMQRAATLNKDKDYEILAEQMKFQELLLINHADMTTVISDYELELLQTLVENKKIKLLPYSRSIEGSRTGFDKRKDIVFVGGYNHSPNVDAVLFFVQSVMPLLRTKLVDFKFYIVGSHAPEEILNLACDDIVVIGFIKELNPFLENIKLSVAPLRYGAGIKGKVGTSLSVGLPVVATNLAVEGMALSDGENVLVANTPNEIADAICQLYKNEELWKKISDNGTKFADQAWGAGVAWDVLKNIIEDLNIKINDKKYPIKLY
jgi:GT2 family glycosyltransferase/glycosyltransferase involved in cell wall biosynthesis